MVNHSMRLMKNIKALHWISSYLGLRADGELQRQDYLLLSKKHSETVQKLFGSIQIQKNGAEIVWVDPNPENTKAIALYKRLGFQQKAFPAYLISEDKEQNSIYMELCKD